MISEGVGVSSPWKESGEQTKPTGKLVWSLSWCLWAELGPRSEFAES